MGELVITILVFVVVIAVTALLFGGWLIVMVCTGLTRLLLLPLRGRPGVSMPESEAGGTMRCANGRCRATNPPVASYCHRCGSPARAEQHAAVRRAAMW